MAIRVLSWNIEKFGKKMKTPQEVHHRVERVAEHIRRQNPDVFGLMEIEDFNILTLMEDEFPDFDFHVTDGPQNQKEIIVAVRPGAFDQTAFTQKRQFNLYNPYLRPGALLSGRTGDHWLNMLFLHTDSGTEARDFGNRYEMFDKVWSLRKALDKRAAPRRERFLVLGDLNTMGLRYPKNRKADELVGGVREIEVLVETATENKMVVPRKEHDLTFRKGYLKSDLDHVVASSVIELATLGQRFDGDGYKVQVEGWIDFDDRGERNEFIRNVSDHCSLLVEVQ